MPKKNRLSFPKKYLLLLPILAILFMFGCTSCSTKPKTGSVKGTVVLNNDTGDPSHDPVDFSEVTVALYEPATLDTTLARLNTEYPQTGVLISQETEFDHRNSSPLKMASTSGDGSFSFKGIDHGTYNLVMLKENWGIRYMHNLEVNDNGEVDLGSMEMYPVVSYQSSVIDETTLKADHCYHITDHVNFVGEVEIEPRAMIFVDPGVMVKFYGGVETPASTVMSEPWRFLPAIGMYSLDQSEIATDDYYNSVAFYGDNASIQNGIFRHFVNSIVFNCDYSEIKNVIASDFMSGISITEGEVLMENLVVAGGVDYGINVSSTSNAESHLSDSIIMNTAEGAAWTSLGTYVIECCYFYNNGTAIRVSNCTGTISHNCFDQNRKDISSQHVSIPIQISYNDFYLSKQYGIVPWFAANIRDNNFYKTNGNYIIIWSPSLANNSFVQEDLDATYNYWEVSNVEDYLLDANDNGDHPDEPCAFYIIYNPRRNSPVPDAGIQ